jgi:hypothetical protein
MLLAYRRTGGLQPSDHETLDIEGDGHFRMWRTIAPATNPPTPVGRFAGKVPPGELEALEAETEEAGRAGDLRMEMPPDSAVEQLRIADATATLPHSGEPNGPWGRLVGRCRSFLVSLTEQPRAALALRVSEGGRHAELVHLGAEPLLLDPSTVTVRAVLREEQEQLAAWSAAVGGEPSDVEARPGWTFPLPFEHGLEPSVTAKLSTTVQVQVLASEDEGWLMCVLQTPGTG